MFNGSKERLHTHVIDIYWIHNPMDVEKLGKEHKISPAQTAIAWAVTKNTLPIIGVTKVHHVEDAAKAALVALTAEEILLLEKAADECGISTIRYWEKKME